MAAANPESTWNKVTQRWDPPAPRDNPLQRRHFVLMRRQRGKHALQRHAVDQEHLDQFDLQEYLQQLQERRAELRDSQPTEAVKVELEQIAEEIKEVEGRLSFSSSVSAHHGARLKGLVDKQRIERGVLSHRLNNELKGQSAISAPVAEQQGAADAADAEAGSSSSAAAAGSSRASKSASSASGAGTSSSGTSTAFLMGFRVCECCGLHYRRIEGKSCFECSREVCGKGGKGVLEPLGGPCVDVYRCGSCNLTTSTVCYDCYVAGVTRTDTQYRLCEVCDGWICTRCPQTGCRRCGVTPICRGCRADHDKQCKEAADEEDDEL